MEQETKKEIDEAIEDAKNLYEHGGDTTSDWLRAIVLMMREQMRERERRDKYAEHLIDKYKLEED